jgi:opacity protein-like surface antigen
LTRVLIALCMCVLAAERVTAQWTTRGAPSDKGWRFGLTPYIWLAGIEGDVGVGPLTSHVDLSPSDVLDHLQFAASLYGEARRQWFVGGIDAFYASVGGAKAVVFRGDTGTFNLTNRQTIVTPMVGYSVGNTMWTLDLLAGARYWRTRDRLSVDRPNGQSRDFTTTTDWWDALSGLRLTGSIVQRVPFTVGGDVGGGGAKSDWQLHGDVGYKLSSVWTLGASYRYLSVDYSKSPLTLDIAFKGFVVAGTYRF